MAPETKWRMDERLSTRNGCYWSATLFHTGRSVHTALYARSGRAAKSFSFPRKSMKSTVCTRRPQYRVAAKVRVSQDGSDGATENATSGGIVLSHRHHLDHVSSLSSPTCSVESGQPHAEGARGGREVGGLQTGVYRRGGSTPTWFRACT